jgi:ABC-type xylose transport system substrate-binding protein
LHIKNLAKAAADMAMDIALNKNQNYEFVYLNNIRVEVLTIILKPLSVNKTNLESIAGKDGVYTMEQIQNVNKN